MYNFVTFSCLLAVTGLSQGSAISLGHGGLHAGLGHYGYAAGAPIIASPIIAPAAISTANMVKAAPIPIIKTAIGPALYPAPVIRTVAPIVSTLPMAKGYGLGGYGLVNPYLGTLAHGYGDLGYGLGYGHGLGYGQGWGHETGLSYGHGMGYGHGLGYGHGMGLYGHGMGYGYGLNYGLGLGYHGHGLGYGDGLGYGKHLK